MTTTFTSKRILLAFCKYLTMSSVLKMLPAGLQQEGISVECQPPAFRQTVTYRQQVWTYPLGGKALHRGAPCTDWDGLGPYQGEVLGPGPCTGTPMIRQNNKQTDKQTRLKTSPLPLRWQSVNRTHSTLPLSWKFYCFLSEEDSLSTLQCLECLADGSSHQPPASIHRNCTWYSSHSRNFLNVKGWK